jgi:small GTP-binding protein
MLNEHERRKAMISGELEALAKLATDVGMTSAATDLTETRLPKLRDERFHLVVLGEFNHGKSTFVNALLGADVLPTGITPTTATINHVVWADKPRARAVLVGGKEVKVDVKAIADWVTVDGKRAREAQYVEVGWPAELIKNKVTLVDTPGVNDLNEQRAEITYGYVPRADAVLFLLDAGQALKESERAFLTTRVLERSRERMIFVIGKIDLLSEKELADVTSYVRDHLARLVDDPPLFAVSARQHLAGEGEKSGMAPLFEHLSRYLQEDRGRILLDNAAGDGLAVAAYLRQSLGVKRKTLDLSLSELEERVARVKAQIAATEKSLEALQDRIRAEGEAVKASIRLDLEQFAGRFERALPGQIAAADAGDLRRYLHLFIQDKFKEWAEREGDKLAALLERLADEVITITNENTKQATAALGDRLGPGDSKIDLDVDSFKYDLSIYAVGALGTTVFLFVNTLVGGILTLAAPILAIVLQSKVSAEIKDQAREKAPEAVRRAAAAMGPHFERTVDDFTRRLSDFVAGAGDKLFKGLTEILEQAVAERKERGGEMEPIAKATDEQLARLDGVIERLGEVRTELWK